MDLVEGESRPRRHPLILQGDSCSRERARETAGKVSEKRSGDESAVWEVDL